MPVSHPSPLAVRRPRPARRLFHRVVTIGTAALLLVGLTTVAAVADPGGEAEAAPKGPVGWDSYRNPERMTEIGSGARTEQFSSFDRTGGNDDGFVGTYSCLRNGDAGCVIAEHTGAGEIASIWFTRDEGDVSKTGDITVELDGEVVLQGSLQDIVNGGKGAPFTYPLVANADQSSGGVYIKVPMPYQSSMRVTTQNNPLFHHVLYRQFPDAEGVPTFDPADPAQDVIDKLAASGTADPKPPRDGAQTATEAVDVAAGETKTIAQGTGPGAISQLRFTLPQLTAGDAASDAVLHDARLRISFDGNQTVDAPLGEFFGTGLGLYDVRSLMFGVDAEAKQLTSWWLMPYRESATVEIVNSSNTAISGGTVDLTTAPDDRWTADLKAGGAAGYFTAIGNRGDTADGRDHVFADTTGRGRVVGVTETVEGRIETGNIRNYLEGDERVFTDGSLSADVHGTGTEDFYEGGWYFNRGTFNAPTNGNPVHEEKADNCQFDCTGMYRLFIAEGMEFDSSMRFGIEHGPGNNEPALLGSTTYLYQQPDAKLAWTDSLDVGVEASEREHAYTSDDPGAVETVTSTFEGLDGPPSPVALDGRATTAAVSFAMAVDGANQGVVLRRVSDQNESYQAAEVAVDGEPVGTWDQPLGNKTARWLDDAFRLPAAATAGKESITITLTPVAERPKFHAASYAALSVVDGAGDGGAPTAPAAVTTQTPEYNAIGVSWLPASDDVYAPKYEIYGSTASGFTPGADNLLARTTAPGFTHRDLGIGEEWYYRVRAIDAAGNAGEFTAEATGTSGSTTRVEAERLLPPVDASAPVESQPDCCGARWSGGGQLWFRPEAADNQVTVEFDVPVDGTFDMTVVQTKAPDYGISTLALDGQPIGSALDGYDQRVVVTEPTDYGQHELTAGTHTLTLTVTGKNASASAFLAGLDYWDLRLA